MAFDLPPLPNPAAGIGINTGAQLMDTLGQLPQLYMQAKEHRKNEAMTKLQQLSQAISAGTVKADDPFVVKQVQELSRMADLPVAPIKTENQTIPITTETPGTKTTVGTDKSGKAKVMQGGAPSQIESSFTMPGKQAVDLAALIPKKDWGTLATDDVLKILQLPTKQRKAILDGMSNVPPEMYSAESYMPWSPGLAIKVMGDVDKAIMAVSSGQASPDALIAIADQFDPARLQEIGVNIQQIINRPDFKIGLGKAVEKKLQLEQQLYGARTMDARARLMEAQARIASIQSLDDLRKFQAQYWGEKSKYVGSEAQAHIAEMGARTQEATAAAETHIAQAEKLKNDIQSGGKGGKNDLVSMLNLLMKERHEAEQEFNAYRFQAMTLRSQNMPTDDVDQLANQAQEREKKLSGYISGLQPQINKLTDFKMHAQGLPADQHAKFTQQTRVVQGKTYYKHSDGLWYENP